MKTTTDNILEEFLAPIIAHCEKTRGAAVELTKRFNAGISDPVLVTTLRRWITADAANRVPPQGGRLIRLLEVWREMRGAETVNTATASIYCAVHGCAPNRDGLECKRCKRTL